MSQDTIDNRGSSFFLLPRITQYPPKTKASGQQKCVSHMPEAYATSLAFSQRLCFAPQVVLQESDVRHLLSQQDGTLGPKYPG